MDLTRTERRLLWVGTALAGALHLLVPGLLLSLARLGYRWVLSVEFTPQDGAHRRVRLLGVGNLVVAAVLRRLLD
ncbi:hypothetical protein HISP_00860 [Haloarcula hispanica N601]|uniref:Uncharacterized protein n=3 Tax=Haloarcula hispanica TaxID=51589 RepID=V5TI49_HALHI|nr:MULTISPECIES: hypothetical protein [Haloarcula]AEM55789.1 conserved hypothetical protein [Haloarcula hispanica ATCC 33960]AHB64617.1 hypothetical protein HISP_00860 [Haloarcula hispanica N601]AJF25807.1 hypothetical protein SG26_08725 [Haloarcula sp. CBA1115]KAA9405558.1 hypothetical protein Har1131_01570 [Haloarcula sp. CBA1131]KZX50209.1 hypothetical protein AV929_16825 [Haloarcula sp. K1]